jgi:hypothetical protein
VRTRTYIAGALRLLVGVPLRFVGLRLGILLAERRQVRGLLILDMSLSAAAAPEIARVADALELIEREDPRRFARIVHDARRVVLIPAAGSAGEYWHHFRAIVLDVGHVRAAEPVALAATIIHEATHARIKRAGIPSPPALRERIELRCVAEEISFVTKFPGSDGFVQRAGERLKLRWWEGDHGAWRVERQLNTLPPLPGWIRRILRSLAPVDNK